MDLIPKRRVMSKVVYQGLLDSGFTLEEFKELNIHKNRED